MRTRRTLGSVLLAVMAVLGLVAAGPAGAATAPVKPGPQAAALAAVDQDCPDYSQYPGLECWESADGWVRLYADGSWNVFGEAYTFPGQWVWMDRSYDYGQSWEGPLLARQDTRTSGNTLQRLTTGGWLFDGANIRVRACTQTLDLVYRCTAWH